MSAKPAPPSAIWGSSPSANVVEPGATKRALGWVGGERPLDGHLNQVLGDHDRVDRYLLDGDLAGSHSIQPATMLDRALQIRDGLGRDRFALDRLGMPAGPIATYLQPWTNAVGASSLPGDWSVVTTSGSPTYGVIDASAAVPWRSEYLSLGASQLLILGGPGLVWTTDALALTLDAALMYTSTGSEAVTFGWQNPTSSDVIGVYVTAGAASAYVSSTGSFAAVSGWVAGGLNHVKVEVEGSTTSGLAAGTYRIRVVLNGVASAFITTTSMGLLRPVIATSTGAAANMLLRVGALRSQWISR